MKSDLTKGMFLMSTAVFLAQLLATGVMIGVIWVVQLVHYPLFASVGANEFVAYHREHVRLITFIVAPAMLIELGSAVYLLANPISPIPRWAILLGLVMIGVAWLTTALASVPMHDQLSAGFVDLAYQKLVFTNWIRTFAWSGRGVLLFWMAWTLLEQRAAV